MSNSHNFFHLIPDGDLCRWSFPCCVWPFIGWCFFFICHCQRFCFIILESVSFITSDVANQWAGLLYGCLVILYIIKIFYFKSSRKFCTSCYTLIFQYEHRYIIIEGILPLPQWSCLLMMIDRCQPNLIKAYKHTVQIKGDKTRRSVKLKINDMDAVFLNFDSIKLCYCCLFKRYTDILEI